MLVDEPLGLTGVSLGENSGPLVENLGGPSIVDTVEPCDRDLLIAAAWLHDIGYSPLVVDTGLHSLDGARYLQRLGYPARLCGLIAHHSGARFEATQRGLTAGRRPPAQQRRRSRRVHRRRPRLHHVPADREADRADRGRRRTGAPGAGQGADAVTMIGRFQGSVPDLDTQRPVLGSWGAIGGSWALPLSLYLVSKSYLSLPAGYPIIGTNGVRDGDDVLRFLLSGATAVQLASAVMTRGRAS